MGFEKNPKENKPFNGVDFLFTGSLCNIPRYRYFPNKFRIFSLFHNPIAYVVRKGSISFKKNQIKQQHRNFASKTMNNLITRSILCKFGDKPLIYDDYMDAKEIVKNIMFAENDVFRFAESLKEIFPQKINLNFKKINECAQKYYDEASYDNFVINGDIRNEILNHIIESNIYDLGLFFDEQI